MKNRHRAVPAAIRRNIKQLLKKAYQSPIVFRLFLLARSLGIRPPLTLARHLRFRGEFSLEIPGSGSLTLFNNAHILETLFFWKGFVYLPWECTTRHLWLHLSKQAGVVLDIGANTGIYAIFAKHINPNARVFAFEPQPNIYSDLRRSVAASTLDIDCRELALSDSVRAAPFYNYGDDPFGSNTTAGSLNADWRPTEQQSIQVQVQTLDNCVEAEGLKSVDLVKIDVESMEPAVLRGATNMLEKYAPAIIVEVLDTASLRAIQSILEKNSQSGQLYTTFQIMEGSGLRLLSQEVGMLPGEHRNVFLCPLRLHEEIVQFVLSSD